MGRIGGHFRTNIVGYIALFIALGGVSYAAVAANSVGTRELKRDAVISGKVKDGSLRPADFRAGQLPTGPTGPAGSPDTPEQVLEKITQVDGAGSNLDADLFDGRTSGEFVQGEATISGASRSVPFPPQGMVAPEESIPLPGELELVVECSNWYEAGTRLRLVNKSPQPWNMDVIRDDGEAIRQVNNIPEGGYDHYPSGATDLGSYTDRPEHIEWQGVNRAGTFWLDVTIEDADSRSCTVRALLTHVPRAG